jgi:hypothetical protein
MLGPTEILMLAILAFSLVAIAGAIIRFVVRRLSR